MKLAIMVPFHLNENQKYLDFALDSLVSQDFNGELSIYCVASSVDAPNVPNGVRLIHDKGLDTATKKFNYFFSEVENASDLLMVVSDDVIVAQNSLNILADGCIKSGQICNPLSNNDNMVSYMKELFVVTPKGRKDLDFKHEYEELAPYYQQLKHYETWRTILVPASFLPFYCTMMTRDVFNKVGKLKEVYDVRYNDVDYCMRAKELGIVSSHNLGAFAFHFGSKTLPKVTDQVTYDKADQEFQREYGVKLRKPA